MELQNSITEMVGRRYVVIGGQPDIQMRKRDRNRKRRELICEYCGEHKVYYSEKRIMRFCDRTCYNRAHADPILGPARIACFDQQRMARNRGIKFLLTFEDWWDIWQKSEHWDERGLKKGQYVMARIGDVGPYSRNNVRIIKTEQNVSERDALHGTNINTNKLTEEQVREIRALQNSGLTQSAVGRKFGVGHNLVRKIWNRTSWAWLK